MIQIERLTKIYSDTGESEVTALKNVTLTLPSQGMIVITGTSGCGKTTLLNILGGFDRPTEGRILFDGEDYADFDEENSREIFEMLKEISSTRLCIVVTHDKELAAKYADRLIELSYGTIVKDTAISDSIEEVIKRKNNGQNPAHTYSRLPVKYSLQMAVSLMKRRSARVAVTFMILAITMSFALILISVLGRDKAESIGDYLIQNDTDSIKVYQYVDSSDSAYAGLFAKNNKNGDKIYELLADAVGDNSVYLDSEIMIEVRSDSGLAQGITAIIANQGWTWLTGAAVFELSVATVLIPLAKMKKIPVIKLLMRE